MGRYATPEDEWRAYLGGTHRRIVWGRRLFRLIPWRPRCTVCLAPFAGPGGVAFRAVGIRRWDKNPNVCNDCIRELVQHEVMGVDAEVSFLFADVRRSSELARSIETIQFAHVMQRFYRIASEVLLDHSAILDKFIGDEAVGFFLPFMTGPDHAGTAVHAAQEVLRRVGEDDVGGVQLGIGVNTGTTFVGMVSSGSGGHEFTAFGDAINLASHLAAAAGAGEILTTLATVGAAQLSLDGLERRALRLKGHQVDAIVLPAVLLRNGRHHGITSR
jgi:adenylate cyclase